MFAKLQFVLLGCLQKASEKVTLVDKFKGKCKIKFVQSQEYLGSVIMHSGSNSMSIDAKLGKGQGIINDILCILQSIYFGSHYFEALVLLRESLLLIVITHDTEVMHNITKKEINKLESLDRQLLIKALETPAKTTTCIMM